MKKQTLPCYEVFTRKGETENMHCDERDIEDGIIWRDIPQIQQRYGDHFNYFDVDPSTVGQYTGLKDKLGKDIFEGDILFDSEWECEGHVAWANEHLSWMIVMSGEKEFLQEFITDGEAMCAGCTHIIGNIHDNPEEL